MRIKFLSIIVMLFSMVIVNLYSKASANEINDQLSLIPMSTAGLKKITSSNDLLQNSQSVNELFPKPNLFEQQAFNDIVKTTMPLTPDQILKLHRMLNMTQKATAASPNTPPKPVVTTRMVNLAPGVVPPVIRLAEGFVSTLIFVDSTGQSWPIVAYDIGNSQAFNIQPPSKNGNSLIIQAMQPYTYGNMVVKLKDLSTPVMLTLIPGQRVVDYRVDLHIEQLGPKAIVHQDSLSLPPLANDILLTVLNNVAPKGAKLLHVSDHQSKAWLVDKYIYLRTKLTVLSPAWIATMRSADGTNVYEMVQTPIILASKSGRVINISVEGF